MPPESLKRRLILGAALWLVLALAAGGAVLGHAFRDAVDDAFAQRLQAHLRALTAVVDIAEDGAITVGRPAGEPRFEQPYSGWYWQVSDGDSIIARSRSLWDFALPVERDAGIGQLAKLRRIGPRGETMDVLERDLAVAANARLVHIAVAANRAEIESEVRRFDLLLGLSATGLGLGLIAAIWVQVGYGLRPLIHLAKRLKALKTGGVGMIAGDYPREIAPLVDALNQVLDHDSRLIERARAHVGNLAHGLKTPLAVMEAELAADRPEKAVLAEQIGRVNRLVDIHLARARAAAGAPALAGSRVAVGEIAEDIASALRKIHTDRAVAITIDCAADARFAGQRDDLAELLGNLMDNACKWAKSRVEVSAAGEIITVEDDGPGLSPEQVDIATGRGARLDESAPGSGLGLAIVADLAGLLDVPLSFGRSTLGGLKVTLGKT